MMNEELRCNRILLLPGGVPEGGGGRLKYKPLNKSEIIATTPSLRATHPLRLHLSPPLSGEGNLPGGGESVTAAYCIPTEFFILHS